MANLNSTEQIKRLFAAGLHFGHQKAKWNPKVKPYLYGVRNGIHLFDLTQTAKLLQAALAFLEQATKEQKVILLVSTKQQTQDNLPNLATSLGLPFVTEKWFGGLLTNWQTTKERLKQLKELRAEKEKTDFARYVKKERNKKIKQIKKLAAWLGGIETLTKRPDILFVLDTVRDRLAVLEARKFKIPVVGIIDSNADPDLVDYPIPANDDSPTAIQFILNELQEAIMRGRKAATVDTETKTEEKPSEKAKATEDLEAEKVFG